MPFTDFSFDPAYRALPEYDPSLWRGMYQTFNRYLEELSDAELWERYANILANKAAFSGPLHRAHRPTNSPWSFLFWVRKEEEIEEEFKLRSLALPELAHPVPAGLRKLPPPVSRSSLQRPDFVARFGNHLRLQDALTHGRFRLTHAKGYLRADLNQARRDDELTASIYTPSRRVKITSADGQPIIPRGKVTYRRSLDMEVYLLCASLECDPAMFHHFNCDACLVVRDLDELSTRLEAALAKQMPEYGFVDMPVRYLDEYNGGPILTKYEDSAEVVEYQPLETKSLAFAYQKEYRFLCYSLRGLVGGPDHIEVELGSLRDIAEYYRFDAATPSIAREPL